MRATQVRIKRHPIEHVVLALFEDALVLEGHRHIQGCEEGGVYHAVGIRQGPFRLEVRLPVPVDGERVQAQYERGLLWIRLPKVGEGE